MESAEDGESKTTQIFACLLLVFTFVIILKRFNLEEIFLQNFDAVHHVNSTSEVYVQEVCNPFHVTLSKQHRTSTGEGLNLELSLLKPGFVKLFWGANIEEFYKELKHPWEVLNSRIQNDFFLEDNKLKVSNYSERSQVCEKSLWHTTVPDKINQYSGAVPRTVYPVVVACTREEYVLDDVQIVIMLSVLHIKDPDLHLDSQVLFQFLITNDNKITTLQPFYVSTETSSRNNERRQYYSDSPFQQLNSGILSSDIINTTDNHGNTQETLNDHEDVDSCCVCQDAEMTIVLLPCRHGCVCSGCVAKLDKCPVCRDVFTSYFRLKNFSQQMSQPLGEQNLGQPSGPHVIANNWWERFNERLNSYFGFT
ncbi:cell growth regulator with RING finger domain protein 1-like isoform X1 [Crassostrea angulata]|uniref:cell growth regulator with RING finger domain protein 1-like isoform X1 n=1 Tax=Magallana angulata TaxID=2784310 RepID=UPI0022B14B39|nr:cell growth regulator with RING finger domain protein 1-like isoform X1 [Crassostrea angulata]